MTSAPGSLDLIPVEECYELLATHEVGRLGVSTERCPIIIPVNYGIDGQTVIIRTHPGTTLTAAEHATVAFEVDEIDQRTRSGWSVLVQGQAEQLTGAHGAETIFRTLAHGTQPWAPGDYGVWLRVTPQEVTGRRIVPGRLPWAIDDRAYL